MNNADMPAMPFCESTGKEDNSAYVFSTGLTKREYFAAMSMQGMLSHPDVMRSNEDYEHESIAHAVAYQSVIMADALLKELEK